MYCSLVGGVGKGDKLVPPQLNKPSDGNYYITSASSLAVPLAWTNSNVRRASWITVLVCLFSFDKSLSKEAHQPRGGRPSCVVVLTIVLFQFSLFISELQVEGQPDFSFDCIWCDNASARRVHRQPSCHPPLFLKKKTTQNKQKQAFQLPRRCLSEPLAGPNCEINGVAVFLWKPSSPD